ncbi:MAG: DUF2339 domain-containing protein [Holophagaceae bacterium]|nr:DUF2339 domain-containing protein [Holophagaceae bacterium]
MEDRLSVLEQQLLNLQLKVEKLEKRMDAGTQPFEQAEAKLKRRPQPAAEPAAQNPSEDEELAALAFNFTTFITLSGRSLIILGGAYLIRAITESQVLPAPVGVALGLLYAVLWILASGRSAGKGLKGDATFHIVVATAIAFPLVFEATVHFHFLGHQSSAAALAFLSVLALGIAWRFSHQAMAWIISMAGLMTAVVLIVNTGAVMPFGTYLLMLGLATLWLGYERKWSLLRWPVALVVDFVALGLVLRAIGPERPESPAMVIGLLMALVGSYLASFAVRTLVRGRDIVPFEIVQTAASLLVGLGGSVIVVRATHAAVEPLGAASLVLGIGSYAVAYAFISRTHGKNVNFYFYTALALVFALAGLRLLLGDSLLVLSFCALAVGVTLLGRRFDHPALLLHGFTYLLGAAWVSGLLKDAGASIVGDAAAQVRVSGWIGWLVVLASAGCALTLNRKRESQVGIMTRVARLGQVGLLVILLGGAAIYLAVVPMTRLLGHPMSQGGVATLRTVVFACSAVALAASAHRWKIHEMGWLAWLLLGGTALKVLIEDLRFSGPSLLFLAFAVIGIAFILVPRLLSKPQLEKQPE